MKRIQGIALRIAVLIAGCLSLSTSRTSAEPILGEEGLFATSATPEKQEAADALALFKIRDYNGSLKLWKEAVKKNPEMPPAQVIMAQLFLQAGMAKEAQAALDRAAADAPGDPEVYLLQANSWK